MLLLVEHEATFGCSMGHQKCALEIKLGEKFGLHTWHSATQFPDANLSPVNQRTGAMHVIIWQGN